MLLARFLEQEPHHVFVASGLPKITGDPSGPLSARVQRNHYVGDELAVRICSCLEVFEHKVYNYVEVGR